MGRVDVQAALAQPDQQLAHQRGVLGRALDQRQRVLDPVDIDTQRDHAAVLTEVHPIDHQRHQIQPGHISGQQLGQGRFGGRDEPARHRRLRGAHRGMLDTGADGLKPDRVAPRGQPGQHPLHGHPPEHLGPGKQLISRHRQLTGAVGGAHSRPRHGHPTPAQAHRTGLVTVPRRGTRRIVAAPRPARRGHGGLHHRGQHLQPGANREGQQALTNLTNQLTQRHAHLLRHGGRARLGLILLVLLCHGGPLPRVVLGRTPEYLPHGRSQAGDRRLKIHEGWDNLGCDPWLGGGRWTPVGGILSTPTRWRSVFGAVLARGARAPREAGIDDVRYANFCDERPGASGMS